jgi:hypothetical protein
VTLWSMKQTGFFEMCVIHINVFMVFGKKWATR